MATYPLDKLYQEVGYIAYHFHWSRDEILEIAHPERHRWVKVISEINQRINAMQGVGPGGPGAQAPVRAPIPPPPPPGAQRINRGVVLTNDIEAVRRVLAERAKREAARRAART